MAAVGEPTCDGMGHLRRHHARKNAKVTGKGQGKPKGALTKGEKKGKGKGSLSRLNFSENHETESCRATAVSLLEAQLCCNELACGSSDQAA